MLNLKQAISAVIGLMLAAVVPASMAQGKTEVQWLGQATTKITTPEGKVIVVDPWLTGNPKTPEQYKKLEALGKVDVILVTHGHMDHFTDVSALARLNKVPVYGPAGLLQSAVALGILPSELTRGFNKSGTVVPSGTNIRVTAVHAEHSSELTWHNPTTSKDEIHVGGEPVGYIIELENGFKIYHMGDTGLFGDLAFIGQYYKPDLVMIPIGGHFTMGPKEAAVAIRDMLKPKYAIPIHYGTFPLLKGTPAELTKELGAAPTKVLAINPGEKQEF